MSKRWKAAEALFLKGRPGKAFDQAVSAFPVERSDWPTLAAKLPDLIKACPVEIFDKRRLAEVERIRPDVLDSKLTLPEPKSSTGRMPFPVIGDASRFCDVLVNLIPGEVDRVIGRIEEDSRAAIEAALEAARGFCGTTQRFEVLVLPEEMKVEGRSLGLATALAAVSRVRDTPLASRWSATGGVARSGVLEAVGHVAEKVALAQEERPVGVLLVPESQAPMSALVCGVATLAEAVDLVFARDLVAAEKAYVAWLARKTHQLDVRRLVAAGVQRELVSELVTRPLLDVHVRPDATPEKWLSLARRIEAAGDQSKELRQEYEELTDETYQAGRVARRDIATFRASSPRLVVLGDLGLGKTTLLRRFAHEAASAHHSTKPLPLLLDASAFAPGEGDTTLADFVRRQAHEWLPNSQVEHLALDTRLEQGRVSLFVDGLNELLDAPARQAFVKALDTYLAAHPSAALVLATRAWAYELPLSMEATVVHLQPFSSAQAQKFWVANHFGREELKSVQRLMSRGGDGQSLLLNPMLLSMAGLLSSQELQGLRHRVELFEKVVRRLVAPPGEDDLGIDRRASLWGEAVVSARKAGSNEAPRARWVKWLVDAGAEAGEANTAFDFAVKGAGLLVRRDRGHYSPFHESVGEFLAAAWLTRAPIDDLGSRLSELPQAPEYREITLQAIARTVLVLDERDVAEDALRAPLSASEPLAVAHALALAVAAGEEGLSFSAPFADALLAGLANHARVYPDEDTARRFTDLAERLLRQDDARSRVRGPLLEALLQLVEAPHAVLEYARVEALRLISLVASSNPRVRDLCSRQYVAGRTGEAERDVAVGLLESDVVPLKTLLPGLGKALEGHWNDPAGRLRTRIGDALRRRLGGAAELRALRDATEERTVRTLGLLSAMAAPDDAEALRALFTRLDENSMDAACGVVAQVVARSESALKCLLASAKEPLQFWFAEALAEVDAHALRKMVVPWLLEAPVAARVRISTAWRASRSEAVSSVLLHLCDLARTADAATALSAVECLNGGWHDLPTHHELEAAVSSGVDRLVALVDASQAVRLWKLAAFQPDEVRQALLGRFLDSPQVLDALDLWRPEDRSLLEERLPRAMAEEDQRLAWSLLRKQHSVSEVGQRALRWLMDTAPEERAREAALLLAGGGVIDLAVARRLTRPFASEKPSVHVSAGASLESFIRSDALFDPEIARNLIDADANIDQSILRDRLLPEMVLTDEGLFELVLDAALDPNPDRARRGAHLVSRLIAKSDALTERTVRRIKRSGAWHLVLGSVGDELHDRPFREQALRRLLEDRDATCDGIPCAIEAASELARDGGMDSALEGVLRRYLPARKPAVALQAALALIEAGHDDAAIHEALRCCLHGTPLQAIVASMLLHSLGVAGEDVVGRLVELQSADEELSVLDWRWQVALKALSTRRQREGIVEHGLFATEAVPEGRDALRPDFRVGTVGQGAVCLLVEMERVEVVPTLLEWLESERLRYPAKQFLDFLGQGAHPQFVAWRLKQIGASYTASLEAFDALVHVIPDDPALLDAMWAHFDTEGSYPQEWVERLVERVQASPVWLSWLEERIAALPATVAADWSALLLSNGLVSPKLAGLNVAGWSHYGLNLRWRLPVLAPHVSMDSVVGQAWLAFLDSADAWGRFVVASALLLEFDASLMPERVRQRALEVLRHGAVDRDPEVRAESIWSLNRLGYEDEAAAAGRAFLLDGDDSATAVEFRTVEALRLLEAGREHDLSVRWLEQLLASETPPVGHLLARTIAVLMAAGEAPAAVAVTLCRWLESHDANSQLFATLLEQARTLAQQGHLDLTAEYFLRRELEGLLLAASWAELRFMNRQEETGNERHWLHSSREHQADRVQDLIRLLPRLKFDQVLVARVLLTAAGASKEQVRALERDFVGASLTAEARAFAPGFVARQPEDGLVEELARAWLWKKLNAA